ncbi:MAG TPA: phosphoethanolamine transferase [Rhodanobacteraceae bacterium]|nr:phosphoethanolamine transferase [Rhodanobacteraceae bacterium]
MNPPLDLRPRWRAGLALGALCAWLMLPNVVWLSISHGIAVWTGGLLLPAALLILVFALCGRAPWLACLLLAPFAAVAPAEAFYICTYLRPSSAQVLASLFATNPAESREYLGRLLAPLVASMFAGVVVASWAAWSSAGAKLRCHIAGGSAVAMAMSLVAFLICYGTTGGAAAARLSGAAGALNGQLETGYPFGMIERLVEYRQQWLAMRNEAAHLDGFRFKARRTATIPNRQIYVLVIGESSRRDHWQLFGYDRATNPELTREPNLVPITDMVTSWPESIAAIPMILTRKPPTARWSSLWHEASVLRAFQEAGFGTWWISNQLPIGKFDSPVSVYALEAQNLQFLRHAAWSAPGSYDDDLLQPLRAALRSSTGDLFIVLHMMGSHQAYDLRYPGSFRQFRPVKSDAKSRVPLYLRDRNSYDNTILYTDHVLAQVIDALRTSGTVAALWFESDHGETLPTAACPREGHGFGTRSDFRIPTLFWYSDAYAKAFPARVATLRSNARNRSMSADTFESLIDMAGVSFPGHDEARSLFSPGWRYQPRLVHGPQEADFDRATFEPRCEILRVRN